MNFPLICGLLALTWAFAATRAQSSSSSQQSSSSQPSSPPAQTQSQAQAAASGQPAQEEDSLAEVARKARAKKPAATNGKVYTEDDLSQMKRMGISVVGPELRRAIRRARPTEPDGDVEPNGEQYWRARAQELLDAVAETDQEIALKKDEIKRFGNGGFDATAGMKQNIARADDRQAQLKGLESRRAELGMQLEELQDEGRKAGVPTAWFR
jgi:hypothetical protein